MKEEIESRFKQNLERARHLVELYAEVAAGQGRRAVETSDVLRAAVVFLHATLEDLVRSVLQWKLPFAPAESLKDVPLEGKKPRSSFTLEDIAGYRGQSVDDVIARSVSASLDESNFNHPGDIERALDRVGLPKSLVDPTRDELASMMRRRHWIVHRADRNHASGTGHHVARPLNRATVEKWFGALETFGNGILSSLLEKS
ncbi:MAG: hypothetical protein HYV07_14055 [Deltaproteobacteria bacterium]|nr:hypothetical protein [Deltaproteobacteria bacterium]